MTLKFIDIVDIDASGRLRINRPEWTDAFAEQIKAGEKLPPIEVATKPNGKYRLVVGSHRLGGHVKAGCTQIWADVLDISGADAAACRMREIKENFYRVGLTELERCVAISAWKDIYEATNPLPKRGRPAAGEIPEDASAIFAASFSATAAKVLGISDRAVRTAVAIAVAIPDEIRSQIALLPIADSQGELIALAREPLWKQRKIVKLLLDPESGIDGVADAVASIDKTPPPDRAAAWEKISNTFSKLKQTEQFAFFDAHDDAIRAWMKSKKA
ncbi:ParB N-terminal domain-containing protein [Rhodopseudomonas palustris]|nr:ParB N-terminal domain-containing protein [Rhodopseudomonas palustris]